MLKLDSYLSRPVHYSSIKLAVYVTWKHMLAAHVILYQTNIKTYFQGHFVASKCVSSTFKKQKGQAKFITVLSFLFVAKETLTLRNLPRWV